MENNLNSKCMVTERDHEIPSVIQSNRGRVQKMSELVEALEIRLSSVIRASMPETNEAKQPTPEVELAKFVNDTNLMISHSIDRIESILSRLEV